MNQGVRLKNILKERGISQVKFAEMYGVSRQAISMMLKNRTFQNETVNKVAELLGMTVKEFEIEYSQKSNISSLRDAGASAEAYEEYVTVPKHKPENHEADVINIFDYISDLVPAKKRKDFVVRGDSMASRINDGDIVIGEKISIEGVVNTYIHVVQYNNGSGPTTKVKRVINRSDKGVLMLLSDNEAYQPIIIKISEVTAIFKVRRVMSGFLRRNEDMFDRLIRLESDFTMEMEDMKSQLEEMQLLIDSK